MDRHEHARRASRLAMQRFHHSGARPVKVLLVGDRGDLLHAMDETSLAQRIADRMWLQTRHGVDVDVLTDLAPVLRAVHGVFQSWRLWRYDVVVVLLGDRIESSLRPRTLAQIEQLLDEVLEDVAGATDVVVLGRHESVRRGRHGAPSGHGLQQAIDTLGSDRVRFRAVRVGEDQEATARAWAVAVAEEVSASLTAVGEAVGPQTAAALRSLPDEETARQLALDDLRIVGRDPDPHLDDLVELARAAFGTQSAEINFIDRDQQWKMAVAGAERTPNPRALSYCTLTIQRAEPTVISDARLDPLLRYSPMVLGPNPVRFYAAHPIESAEGYRIGSFCVYDTEPRDVRSLDLAVLRDLALLAQAEITGADAMPRGVDPALAAW